MMVQGQMWTPLRGLRAFSMVTLTVLCLLAGFSGVGKAAGIGLHYTNCIGWNTADCAEVGSKYLSYADLYIAPDDRSAYVLGSSKVALSLSRSRTGQLSFSSCIATMYRYNSNCRVEGQAPLTNGPAAISPDGLHVYEAGRQVAVSTFRRMSDGSLRFLGCLAVKGMLGCDNKVRGPIVNVEGIGVGPAGHEVYVGFEDGIAVYRQPKRGPLVFQSCVAQKKSKCQHVPVKHLGYPTDTFAFSQDGRTVFADSGSQVNVFRLSRGGDLRFQGCVGRPALSDSSCWSPRRGSFSGLSDMEISPSGKFLYVSSVGRGSISTFGVGKTGHLKFMDCLGFHGLRGCRSAPQDHLFRPGKLALAPDGRSLYASLQDSQTVERYDVNKSGNLRFHGCISSKIDSDCEYFDGSRAAITLDAISSDGKSFYFGERGSWSVFGPSPD